MVSEIKTLENFNVLIGVEKSEQSLKDSIANNEVVPSADKLTVVDFFADWCGPCKVIAPKFVEFSTEFTEVDFFKVNVDEGEGSKIAAEHKITAMPTFKLYKNGKLIDQVVGANINKVKSLIQANL